MPSRQHTDEARSVHSRIEPGPVIELDELTTITSWSAKAELLFGWAASEVVGRDIRSVVVAPTDHAAFRSWRESLGADRALTRACPLHEFVTLHRNGTTFHALFKLLPPLSQGRPRLLVRALSDHIGVTNHVEDLQKRHAELEARVQERTSALSLANAKMKEQIAERHRVEEALYNEKEFLTAILNNMADGIVACDENGILTVFNRATREFHGLLEKPIPPDQWTEHYDLYAADGKTPLKKEDIPLYRAFQGEAVRNFEMVIAPKSAPVRRVVASGQAIRDAQGHKLGAIATMHDVTARRRAEEELRTQQFLLQYILNFVPHAIFWKDRQARFLGGNQTFLHKALGVGTTEEMVGKTDYDFFPKEQADYFRRCDFTVMETGKPLLDIEEPQDQREGGVRVLLTSKVPLRDATGAVIGLLGSFADITDRKRMEEELETARSAAEAAAQAKSEFLATVSHELRTPLTLILGPLEMILAEHRIDLAPPIAEALERIQRNATRLYTLVNDILDFTKLEAGKTQVHWEPVDVTALVSEIVTDALPAARSKDIRLGFEPRSSLDPIPLDRGKFEKIVWNLLGNALKFTPNGGRVDVVLQSSDQYLELSVADSGPGIATDQQGLLFHRFQQLDSSATRKYEGTGLGLALVKEFVGLMGGEVGLESEVGKGSRFFVRLAKTADHAMTAEHGRSDATAAEPLRGRQQRSPLANPPRSERREATAASAAATSKPMALVVDDNADMRDYVTEILSHDYRVETAENGLEALEAARVGRPDVIVSDIMMPEMDGLELVSRLKADEALRNVPIILLTAKASREEVVTGLDSGADDYLGKPFGPTELKARVHAAVRLRRAFQRLEASLEELRKTQEQLVQASKMAAMGTLIAGLSHELNNPLAAISMNTQLLANMRGLDEPAAQKALSRIVAQTERCARLVTALLDFSRRKPSVLEWASAETLLARVAELAAPLAHRKGVELAVETNVRDFDLHVCEQEIETALLNLVGNAIGATAPGGKVLIGAEEKHEGERRGGELWVVDRGHGIAPDVLPQIFDPFFTTKPPGEGTGLGLSMTRRIVEAHGGTIRVESELGKGTAVRVWLPGRRRERSKA